MARAGDHRRAADAVEGAAPGLPEQIAAIKQCIANERGALVLAQRLQLDAAGIGAPRSVRERRIAGLEAALVTLQGLAGAPARSAA